MRAFSLMASATALCLASLPVLAAEVIDEKVVVTATKQQRKSSETGSQVTVITRRELDRKGTVFVVDVLRDAPGVTVTQTGGPGGQAAVRLRGEEGYRTLLLIDGMKLSDPAGTQNLFNFANLLARDVERIEILRGPQALLYGADAIGGVIAISTRRGSNKTEAGLALEGGSFGTVSGGVFVRGAAGAFDYALNVSGFDNEGISAKAGTFFTEKDAYTNGTLHAVVGLKLSDNIRAEAVARYTDARAEFDGFFGENNVLYTEQFNGRVAISGASKGGQMSGIVAANFTAQNRADYENGAPFLFGSRFDSERTRLEALSRYGVSKGHDLVLGADYEDENATTDALARGRSIAGLFAEYQGHVLPATFLTVGIRFDDHEEFGEHISWRVTAAHKLVESETMIVTAKASTGTGFRAPSLYELYDTFSGDPSLKEETGFGWDLGVDVDWTAISTTLNVAYFNQRIQDEIRFDPNVFVYIQNPSTTASRGVETSLATRLTDDLRLSAAYTYTDATVSSLDAENGLPRQRRPRHVGSLSLNWLFDAGRGNLNATLQTAAKHEDGFFTFRTPLDARAVLNLAARYRVDDILIVTLRGQNVLDERYQEAAGFNSPRAGVFAGLELQL